MASWEEFATAEPELAAAGKSIFYQYGTVGLAFLATVRRDGGPRVHPMCPVIDGKRLCGLIVPSQKRDDLVRDGRYAMHAFPVDGNEDAFYITGTARRIEDYETLARIIQQFVVERNNMDPALVKHEWLFEFDITTCLLTRTTGYGDWNPKHTVWRETAE